mgnify:CR=1 FL=1
MAFKTMLRQLISKWGIMSIDLQKAFEADVEAEENPDYFQVDEADPALPDPADDTPGADLEMVDIHDI